MQYVNLLQMIRHTITFAAITNLQLAFVTFTTDIYRTDAAICSQTETTTDWKDQSSSTAYQQMAATETPENLTNVASTFHKELSVSLDLVSAFNISSYVGNCSDLQEQTDADEFHYIPYDEETPDELSRTTREMHGEFNSLMKIALGFICTENKTVGHDFISMARIYVHNFTEFMIRLNCRAEAIDEVAVGDNVADLYRTSIQHVHSVMEMVEYLTKMISDEDKFCAMIQNISQHIEATKSFNAYSFQVNILEELNEVESLQKNMSERARNMSEHKDGNYFTNVITSSNISRYLDAQYWENVLEQKPEILAYNQTQLHEKELINFFRKKVTPVLMAIVLVVGITGNGLLLTIFVRHKETRTPANSMLINLIIVDFLSLVVNVLLNYWRVDTHWYFGCLGCKLFTFFSFLLMAVSTYSVVMISLQRYVAITQMPSLAWCHQSKKTKYFLIATVWGIGCILSVPNALSAHMKSEKCRIISAEDKVHLLTADLITFFVVPLIITVMFSGVTAYRIRSSIRRIPGEATGQEQFKHNRMVSSTVLFALTGIFVVSYSPFFLYCFLVFVVGISMNKSKMEFVYVVLLHLTFTNCCLNPILLFVMSKRYRGYIKRYCGHRQVQSATKSGSSKETSL
jgi:gastrin-releasing peptide receptor